MNSIHPLVKQRRTTVDGLYRPYHPKFKPMHACKKQVNRILELHYIHQTHDTSILQRATTQHTASEHYPSDKSWRQCQYCFSLYAPGTEIFLTLHEQAHKKGYTPCRKCNEMVKQTSLASHMQWLHTSRQRINCTSCNKSFKDQQSLYSHKKKHRKKTCSPNPCPICEQACSSARELSRHMQVHEKSRPFECPECSRRFQTQTAYKKHLASHGDKPQHECPICFKQSTNTSAFSRHMANQHSLGGCMCIYCEKPFTSRQATLSHSTQCSAMPSDALPLVSMYCLPLKAHSLDLASSKEAVRSPANFDRWSHFAKY